MSDDFLNDDVQVGGLLGAAAEGMGPAAAYGVRAGRASLGSMQVFAPRIAAADSSVLSPEAKEIAAFAKASPAAADSQEIAWTRLQGLQHAVRSNALPIDSIALAHAILRDENFPQAE